MKMTFAVALLALSLIGQAPAQPQGGFQDGPRPPMMGRPMGGPGILLAPDVQKELGLNDDQRIKLGQLLGSGQGGPGGPPPQGGFGGPPPQGGPGGPPPPQGGQGGPPDRGPGRPPQQGGFGGPPPPEGQGFPGGPVPDQNREEMQKRQAEMDAKIKGILNASQYTRYHELVLQQRGPSALLEKQVGDKVGLSQDQRKEIQNILEAGRMQMRPPQQGERPDPGAMRQQMDARRKEMGAKILAVLSSDQKSTWQKMLGKPFTFQRPGPPPQGGRGGGQG